MPEFRFLECGPEGADLDTVQKVGLFLFKNVWENTEPLQSQLDFLNSYHLAFAIDEQGVVISAGSMLGSPTECHIADIATDPSYRGLHELGSTILEMLENKARRLGAKTIGGWAKTEARGFFVKHGYVPADPSVEDSGEIIKHLD